MRESGKKNKTLSEKLKRRNILHWTRCRWQDNTNKSKGTRVARLRICGRFLKYENETSIFINERVCLISYVTTRFPRWSPTHSQSVAYLQDYFINYCLHSFNQPCYISENWDIKTIPQITIRFRIFILKAYIRNASVRLSIYPSRFIRQHKYRRRWRFLNIMFWHIKICLSTK
jgi:hypothetical protein